MEKLPRLIWEPSYSYHVEMIDAQHRKLFDIVNHLIDVFEATRDSDSSDLLPVLNELVEYGAVPALAPVNTIMPFPAFPPIAFVLHPTEPLHIF